MFCLTFLHKYWNFCCLSFEIEHDKVQNIIVFYFCADRPAFWPSAALRHIITESASHHVRGNPAQHRTHASAWEIWIFEVEKSTGECISWEISWNSKFLKIYHFLWFVGLNFHSWRDLLPRNGSRSIWKEISKNINFFSIWSFLTCSYVESSCILCSLFKSIPGLKLRCQVAARYI